MSPFLRGYVVPGRPHPLLAAHASPAWGSLRRSFEQVAAEIASTDADLLVLHSTGWPSVIGHQVQAHPEPSFTLVDEEFHALGSIPYRLRMDPEFAVAWRDAAQARGLHCRTVAYDGFPVDTGTVVALSLLNPGNRLPACVVSCNMYADRQETVVLGKATADAVARTGRRAIAVAVTALSNRMFTTPIDPADDRISSLKDDEWNRKLLELLADGRLEDVSQLARTFTAQANGDSKLKAFWWLAASMGQHNGYDGRVFDYQPIHGTGAAIVGLVPAPGRSRTLEFDEDDVDVFTGDREVLAPIPPSPPGATAPVTPEPPASPAPRPAASAPPPGVAVSEPRAVDASTAPAPVGPYPHARRVGNLLFVSGMGPRQPGTDAIPGGPVRDPDGTPRDYDVTAQTHACIENIRRVLVEAGSDLAAVRDVTVFLVDMDRDFHAFNAAYTEHFSEIRPTRTTVEVRALPTPIAVEMKVIAEVS